MIEQDLYNYWTKELSFKNLSKNKQFRVMYNKRLILAAVLGIGILILLLSITLSPLITAFDNKILPLLTLFLLVVDWFLLYGIKRFKLRWLIDENNNLINEYELKEKKLKEYLETHYIHPNRDNTPFYQGLIDLYEKGAKPIKIDLTIYLSLIGIAIALCVFIFDDVKGFNDRIEVIYFLIIIMVYFLIGHLLTRMTNNRPEWRYSFLAIVLRRLLIKSHMKSSVDNEERIP